MRPIQKAYLFFIALLMTITAYLIIASNAGASSIFLPGVRNRVSMTQTTGPITVTLYPTPGVYHLGFPDMSASITLERGQCSSAYMSFTNSTGAPLNQYHMECVKKDDGLYHASPLLSLYAPTVLTDVRVCVYDGERSTCIPFAGMWEYR